MHITVSLQDIMAVVIGLGGLLMGYIKARADRLPRVVRDWLARHEIDVSALTAKVTALVTEAQTLEQANPEYRRVYAVKKLQEWVTSEAGFALPTSIANLIVEFVYQQYRKAVKK